MASRCFFSCPPILCKDFAVPSRRFDICRPINSSQQSVVSEPFVTRRSANYESSIWSYEKIQSLSTKYLVYDYTARANGLKEAVKTMIRKRCMVGDPLSSLELVDDLQRLGISYHFKEEISDLLDMIYDETHSKWNTKDLNLQSLGFRLLRQHGHPIAQDIFSNFKDKIENLNPRRYEDMVAILNLYEASYLSFEDECTMDEARDLTTRYLKENLYKINERIAPLVSHALEVPLHWRVPRVEAKWFIEVYEARSDMNPTLLALAKLDFNMVQAIHVKDLKHASRLSFLSHVSRHPNHSIIPIRACDRWWKDIAWDKKLTFARDRLVECFLWTVGYSYVPGFSLGRRDITKVNAIITTIDDVYDVYGTLDELEQFTDAVIRWDINATEGLPDYMKICFIGLYNTINEITYTTLINTKVLVLPYLKKAWADLCKAYLVEAKWYHSGHIPTLQDYLDNACITIGSPLTLMHIKCSTSITSTEEIVHWLNETKNIVNHTALIVRLADDLATSSDEMARGDSPKSIQCYMHESGATEEEARRYIKNLIMKTWKKLNKERASAKSQLVREFIDYAMDIVRMAQFMYGKGDGHGLPNVTKSHVLSLLFNPIQEI